MSHHVGTAIHPETGEVVTNAVFFDDYFGHREFGVKFPDGQIFRASEVPAAPHPAARYNNYQVPDSTLVSRYICLLKAHLTECPMDRSICSSCRFAWKLLVEAETIQAAHPEHEDTRRLRWLIENILLGRWDFISALQQFLEPFAPVEISVWDLATKAIDERIAARDMEPVRTVTEVQNEQSSPTT